VGSGKHVIRISSEREPTVAIAFIVLVGKGLEKFLAVNGLVENI